MGKNKNKECQEGHSLVSVDDDRFTELVSYCTREGCNYVEEGGH